MSFRCGLDLSLALVGVETPDHPNGYAVLPSLALVEVETPDHPNGYAILPPF